MFIVLFYLHVRWLKPNGKGYGAINDLSGILCRLIHVMDTF